MMKRLIMAVAAIAMAAFADYSANAQATNFSDHVKNIRVGQASDSGTIVVPFIFWGGDFGLLYANGGLKTASGSIYDRLGLDIQLVPGDDYIGQVKNYMSGKSPFLRGTFRMIGMSSGVTNTNRETTPQVLFQMTYSKGDHLVVRGKIRTINDLPGSRIAIQEGGPHCGMLDDILDSANLQARDINIVWCKNLTGPGSPEEAFRNGNVDAAFVVTPDMIKLTGGLQNVGNGSEGTIKGSRVLVSTSELSRSIADVLCVRSDWASRNQKECEAITAGYLKAVEEILEMQKDWESKGSRDYENFLSMIQSIYGKDLLPTLEEDTHGFLLDASFVGHPGNVKFFEQSSATANNFWGFNSNALDMADSWGYSNGRPSDLIPSEINWNSSTFTNYLAHTGDTGERQFDQREIMAEITNMTDMGTLDDNTLYQFTVNFQPNQTEFGPEFDAEFEKAVRLADKYANATIAVRAHADPSLSLSTFVRSAMADGSLKRSGQPGNWRYTLGGRPLDMSQTNTIVEMISSGRFENTVKLPNGQTATPGEVMRSAMNLSHGRAVKAVNRIINIAHQKGLNVVETQIQPIGVGINEPFIAVPRNQQDALENMRVEIRLVRTSAEAVNDSVFDF